MWDEEPPEWPAVPADSEADAMPMFRNINYPSTQVFFFGLFWYTIGTKFGDFVFFSWLFNSAASEVKILRRLWLVHPSPYASKPTLFPSAKFHWVATQISQMVRKAFRGFSKSRSCPWDAMCCHLQHLAGYLGAVPQQILSCPHPNGCPSEWYWNLLWRMQFGRP